MYYFKCHFKEIYWFIFLSGRNAITGFESISVHNLQTATFKWNFNFERSAILLWELYKLKDGTNENVEPVIIRNSIINKLNTKYYGRVHLSSPTRGLIVDVKNVDITDGGRYKINIKFNSFSPDVYNITNLVVIGKFLLLSPSNPF